MISAVGCAKIAKSACGAKLAGLDANPLESEQTMSEREAYPSLTGLRFVLAAWITVYHLFSMFGPPAIAEHPLLAVGNARVDIFFVLSGFVLAHVYAVRPQARRTPFQFGTFLIARVARLYPLHLLALGILGAAVAAAHVLGRQAEVSDYTVQGLLANLFMLQATNIPGSGAWNFPAWTLGAEAFGYLLFPIFIGIGLALRHAPLRFLGLALLTLGAVGAVWPFFGFGSLAEATQTWGIVRGALCMFVGVAARHAFEAVPMRPIPAIALALSGAAIAAAAAASNLDLWLVALGACALITGIAGLDRAGAASPLATPALQVLGRWSYALFVLHVPVFLILARAFGMIGWDGVLNWPVGAAMLAIALVVSWPAHVLVEEPTRRAIRAAFQPKPNVTKATPVLKTL